MASRLNLHEELCKVLGSNNVYFQPPESIKLKYPCIVYSLSGIDRRTANNASYNMAHSYTVTLIDSNPDSSFIESILSHFQMCRFDRSYASDNLNHFIYTIYY